MATQTDWTLLQDTNPSQGIEINQLPTQQLQTDEQRIQKVVYPNLSDIGSSYVELAHEAENAQGPQIIAQEDHGNQFEINTFKYISIQALSMALGSFLGIFRCFGFFFVKSRDIRRTEWQSTSLIDYCRWYQNIDYNDANQRCQYYYRDYLDYMNETVSTRYHYRWTFWVLISLIVVQQLATLLLRNTQLMKRFQKINYWTQTVFVSFLFLSITNNNDHWSDFYQIFIPIGFALFGICQAQIISIRKYQFELQLGKIFTILVYICFIVNTIIAFTDSWFSSTIIYIELAVMYGVYYFVQLEQSLRTSKLVVINEQQEQTVMQRIRAFYQGLSEPVEEAQVEQVSKQYLVLKKKYVYLAGAASLLALFILSLTQFFVFIITLNVIFNTIFETQIVSSKARFEKEDYFIASSLVFVDFVCPLKNICRSIKNARSQ